MATVVQQRSPAARRALIAANRGMLVFARHWLAITNALSIVLASLPLLGAWLAATNQPGLAQPIYRFYAAICTQVPSHSWYPWAVQLATCQRETAIYVGMALAGLVFIPLRQQARPLSWSAFGLMTVPIVVDGLTQLLGWRESTPVLRVLTGGLFGLATVWLLYPRLEVGMADIRAIIEARFRRLGLI